MTGLQGELGAQSWSWAAASLPSPCPKVDDSDSQRDPRVAESDVFPKCLDISAISSLLFCLEKACDRSTRTRGRTARARDRHTSNSSARGMEPSQILYIITRHDLILTSMQRSETNVSVLTSAKCPEVIKTSK